MPNQDERWMEMALNLARNGEGVTSPNPMVGAVVVKGEEVVGSGWHRAAGEAHAEILALEAAGPGSAGATLYLTLEPCVHYGNTAPCADAVVAAGAARVVVAMQDPDSRMQGRGIEALKQAGIDVEVGVLASEAQRLNRGYCFHRASGRPFVTYKAAITLDGRTSAFDGTSKWITGTTARRQVQHLRAVSDAVCVGIGTVLADDPSLTVHDLAAGGKQRLRVIVDSSARTPVDSRLLSSPAPLVVAVTSRANEESRIQLQRAGAEILVTDSDSRVNLLDLLRQLGERGVTSLLLEGGPTLAGAFQVAGLVDRYILYVAPKLVGGPNALGLFEGLPSLSISEAQNLVIEHVELIDGDIRIEAAPAADASNPAEFSEGVGLDLPALTTI